MDGESVPGQQLHEQLLKLGSLMSRITNDVYSPPSVDIRTVKYYSDCLDMWHQRLPPELSLSHALQSDCEQKYTILLAHCAYLASIIFLTRRLFVDHCTALLENRMQAGMTFAGVVVEDYSRMCLSAARQLTMVPIYTLF